MICTRRVIYGDSVLVSVQPKLYYKVIGLDATATYLVVTIDLAHAKFMLVPAEAANPELGIDQLREHPDAKWFDYTNRHWELIESTEGARLSEHAQAYILSRLQYKFGPESGSPKEMFDRLLEEYAALRYGVRKGNRVDYEGKAYYFQDNPSVSGYFAEKENGGTDEATAGQ
jgi:hypothetical protein